MVLFRFPIKPKWLSLSLFCLSLFLFDNSPLDALDDVPASVLEGKALSDSKRERKKTALVSGQQSTLSLLENDLHK